MSTRPRTGKALRRGARRRRRLIGALVLLSPSLWILLNDLGRRYHQILGFDSKHRLGYLATVAGSALFWAVILYAASRRRGALARGLGWFYVALFTIVVGVESAFHSIYRIYLSLDGQIHSRSIPWAVAGTLPLSRPAVIAHLALALVVGAVTLWLARRYVRPRPVARWLAPALVPLALVGVTQVPASYRTLQSTTPDLIYFHGLTALVKERLGYTHDSRGLRVQRRSPEPVPDLVAKPKRPRNVLLILQESQRADVTCIEYDPRCDLATRFSNRALPNRMPLLQLRSNASTTAISISNIWSGVLPTEKADVLLSVPLIWEYAHAAGYDTAYWTSQNLMFGNARLYVQDIPASHRVTATELDPEADIDTGADDHLLSQRVIEEWGELREPFFAVAHYSNNHFPYVYDPDKAPFQPSEKDKSPSKNEAFKNYYRNVVYRSDEAVAALIAHVRASQSGARTVIVYTADHGESFREHWQLGHTSSLFDEEVHVPGWIDAPEGTLAPEEQASVRSAREAYVTHMDLAPTFLDLLGVYDDPRLAPFRARMVGHPLTRSERTLRPLPLTNCSWLWQCDFRNWGMMQGPMKLEAREWDAEYHCFDVSRDELEHHNLGEAACGPLADLARQTYHAMPNVTPPGTRAVDWGRK